MSGTLPIEIFNISSVNYFAVGQNRLHGRIPPNVSVTIPNLLFFSGSINQFTGSISLANASKLSHIDLSSNDLIGIIPAIFGNLQRLNWLNFEDNHLGCKKTVDLSFLLHWLAVQILKLLD